MQNKNLWAPWRMSFIEGLSNTDQENKSSEKTAGSEPKASCFLCDAAGTVEGSEEAKKRLVLVNDSRGLILLNLYPYTNGHLLVAPTKHLADLSDLSSQERNGYVELIAVAERILVEALNPQGMNIGMNIGRCAGAGLPGHLHAHIVPRWSGDTNYMQVIGQVRVIPQALKESYERLSGVVDNCK